MEELQNLAVFLISGGCDWINGETIAMDGGQALAMGGNFYQLRDWSDADWTQAREQIKAQNEKDRREGVMLSSLRKCLVPGDWMDGIGVEGGVRYIEERLRSWN
jgi:hypothetical protein